MPTSPISSLRQHSRYDSSALAPWGMSNRNVISGAPAPARTPLADTGPRAYQYAAPDRAPAANPRREARGSHQPAQAACRKTVRKHMAPFVYLLLNTCSQDCPIAAVARGYMYALLLYIGVVPPPRLPDSGVICVHVVVRKAGSHRLT